MSGTCIIFNPTARGEKARKFRRYLEETRCDWEMKPTTCAGDARRLAREAVGSGFETIVAAGGDGTLNEVLNGMADAPGGFEAARLGVLPLGTINVFARELRLPLDINKVCPVLDAAREIRIDAGCAEFTREGRPEKRWFLQLAGAGLDARSVELVNWEIKKKAGPAAYVIAGLQALTGDRPRIQIHNGSQSASGDLVLIGNGRFYGGSFPLFHKSDLQDGLLDAVVFEKIDWSALPGMLWDFAWGKYFKEGAATYLQGKEFRLASDSPASLQLEGELTGALPATISVVPRALRVVVP